MCQFVDAGLGGLKSPRIRSKIPPRLFIYIYVQRHFMKAELKCDFVKFRVIAFFQVVEETH